MELKIRDVDPHAVKKIDELAKRKGMSRSAYLKEMIEKSSMLEMLTNADDNFEKQLQVNTLFLEKASDSLDELVEVLKELMVNEE